MAEIYSTSSISPQLSHDQAANLIRILKARQQGFLPSIADVDFLLELISGPTPPREPPQRTTPRSPRAS
jgi:hypothetical protein